MREDVSTVRLLVVSQHYWPENFRVTDLVSGLVSEGVEVDVLCGLPNYPKGEWFEGYDAHGPFDEVHEGIRLYRCREVPRLGNTSVRIFLNYVSWPLSARFSLRRLEGDYDAVMCFNTSPVLMIWPAIAASRKFQAPLTSYVLDLWPENLYSVLPIDNALLRAVAKAVSDWHYRNSDRIIALSDGMLANIVSRVGVENGWRCVERHKQYSVIPHYCEDFYAANEASSKHSEASNFVLAFAGNLSPAQDLSNVFKAVKLVNESLDLVPETTFRLEIYGDGMAREGLVDQVIEMGLEDIVIFKGVVSPEAVPSVLGKADALLVSLIDSPDLGLTIPGKLASCMASRKPLIVSITGAGADAARESGGALVNNAGDVEGLAVNILTLMSLSCDEREELGDRSFAYYERNYSRSVVISRIKEFVLGT